MLYEVITVQIERIQGKLSDHYDPRTNVVRLSDEVYGSQSVAAIGVAAHEVGHAIQHATGYTPVKIRTALVITSYSIHYTKLYEENSGTNSKY